MPCTRSVGRMCWRRSPIADCAITRASAAFTPSSGAAEACDALPWKCASNSANARVGGSRTSSGAGCAIIAACTPAKAPRSRSMILPPPLSSAGVPKTLTVRPTWSATRAAARPAPTASAAITLWPHACPISGSASYSAQMATCRGPEPARATNAVGRSQTPRSTRKPPASRTSAIQPTACSSSKASSGRPWIRRLRARSSVSAAARRSRAPSFTFIASSHRAARRPRQDRLVDSVAMYDGLLVIDADAHKMENPVVFFDYLDAPYRGRLASRTDRHSQPRLVIRDLDPRTGRPELERVFPQPEGPGKGAFAAIHPETAIGGVFNRIRVEHMDREGIDAQVLYGSMTLSFEAILDPELAVACMRAYNSYIADDCRAWRGRLFPVGFISLADVGEAVREVRRCVEELGMIGVHLPPSVPVPHPAAPEAFPRIRLPKHLCHPDFHPVLAAAAELDAAVGVHGSPGVYLPSGIAEQVDTFILSHIFGHRNQMQMALATCVFEGLFDRFLTLRMGFLEAGCGWLPDLVHAFHEHWEKRIRDFDPATRMPRGRFARELLRERVGADAKRHPLRKLRQALGEWGEDVACFSADYGHWDSVLTDCVRNVVRVRPYAREHLKKLLAGNCLRFYGR